MDPVSDESTTAPVAPTADGDDVRVVLPTHLAPDTSTAGHADYVPASDLVSLIDDNDDDRDDEDAGDDDEDDGDSSGGAGPGKKRGRSHRFHVVRLEMQQRLRADELRNNLRELTQKIRIFFM